MHYSTISTLFFAALATAQHHRFHNRRLVNSTVAAEHTTLTVYATSVHTITSCAASITNCPARTDSATVGDVVTDTIAVYTTVCPVAEASSASSALLRSATSTAQGVALSTGAASKASSMPLSTGASNPVVTAPGPDSTLTYTLGSGTSTTVVTTTIKHYSTVTEYAVKATSSAQGVTGQNVSNGSEEPTTTYTQTSTSTRYVTVSAVASGSAAASKNGGVPTGVSGAVSSGLAGASSNGACAPVTVTVAASTVTVAAVTMTVTVQATASAVSAAGKVTSPAVIMSTATVVPLPITSATSVGAPYGYGNGTNTAYHASSGFLSIVKTSSVAGVASSSAAVPKYSEYPTY